VPREEPFPHKKIALDSSPISFIHRLASHWETFKIQSRLRMRNARRVAIFSLRSGDIRTLTNSDIPLVFLTRNAENFLPSFLAHYRQLGVTRFLCVDDQSSDATREILLKQSDVELFGSPIRYGEADRGRLWRQELFRLFGIGRWYLNVDCDEYFIYDGYQEKSLHTLISQLEALKIMHCPAPMIDLYPEGVISSAVFDGSSDVMPWQVASMFDASGYHLKRDNRSMSLTGGPRKRILNEHVELMKYPLLYVQNPLALASSIHKPLPYYRNFSPILGSLLHFKFFSDALLFAQAAVADGQYYGGAHVYKNVVEVLSAHDDATLAGPHSVSFKSSRQLADLGFFAHLPEQ
jgi:hypothetical protein